MDGVQGGKERRKRKSREPGSAGPVSDEKGRATVSLSVSKKKSSPPPHVP